MKNSPILVIGKNGKTGSRVTRRLKAMGYATRSVSRSTTPSFDWTKPQTWAAAMQGAEKAYVTYQPDLAVPEAESTIREFVRIASDVGIRHVVLLSGRGEEGARRAEEVVRCSGLTWNIVRASWFFQNFSESFLVDGILAGDTQEPFVDADDIADVAVATLTDSRHRNKLFEVTGPRSMTFAQCTREISEAIGRAVRYGSISVETYIDYLREQGVPQDMQWLLRELFTVVLDGRNSHVTYGVEQALGRPANDFKAYVRKAIDTGVWSAGSVATAGVSS